MTTLFQKMRQKYYLAISFIIILPLAISACGGGNGGGTADLGITYSGETSPATLTDENSGQLASNALSNGSTVEALVLSAAGNTNSATGPTSSHSIAIARATKELVNYIESNPETIRSTNNSLAVTTQSDTMVGACGGEATYTIGADSNTGSFDGSVDFITFCNEDETLNGAVTFSGQINLNTNTFVSFTMTFTLLTISNDNESATANGTVSVNTTDNTVAVDMAIQDNVTNKTNWVNNYIIQSIDQGNYEQITISGRFYDSDHGYVELTTVSPLLISHGANWAYSGQIKISAANNASATLTADSATTYTLAIDKDGDGIYETTQSGPWTEL